MLFIIEWCESDLPVWNNVHSSGIKQLDIVLEKLMFSGNLLIKVRSKIEKYQIFNHITHFGSK